MGWYGFSAPQQTREYNNKCEQLLFLKVHRGAKCCCYEDSKKKGAIETILTGKTTQHKPRAFSMENECPVTSISSRFAATLFANFDAEYVNDSLETFVATCLS
jgi:hypothetical protein